MNLDGSLYELVSRGNKDVYFQEDSKNAQNLFDNRYGPTAPIIHELRRIPPLNTVDFGRTSEFQLEVAGDFIVSPTLLIDLPSWLPLKQQSQNKTSVVNDGTATYGYTNGIGYFLFEKIQFLQDNILLQEFSGDTLWIQTRARGSLNGAFLDDVLSGIHGGTGLEIGRNATPGQLRLQLPLIGCQGTEEGGFPSICVPNQAYKIKVFLRKLEDLVEASDGQEKPAPWNKTLRIQTERDGSFTSFQTLGRNEMGLPSITLETRHVYTNEETRQALRKSQLDIPFERLYENVFQQSPQDYNSTSPFLTRVLDAVHPCSRILIVFRSYTDLRANRLWKVSSTTNAGEYYSGLKLLVAGRERTHFFDSLVWNSLDNHAKEERDSGLNIATIHFGYGEKKGTRAPMYNRQPADGTINFSTADKPTLFLQLTDILSGQKRSELRVVVETWAVFSVEDGRGGLKFGN